jgi:hypothetical protein
MIIRANKTMSTQYNLFIYFVFQNIMKWSSLAYIYLIN